MRLWRRFGLLSLLIGSLVSAYAQQPLAKDDVHWCSAIPVPAVWREARLTAVFAFDLDPSGKPIHIKSIHIPLVKDDGPFLTCISGWLLPSASGRVTASISWEWGCKGIEISQNETHKSFPCQPPKSNTQLNSQ